MAVDLSTRSGKLVNCVGCQATISNDRECCPHCGTTVPDEVAQTREKSENETINLLTDKVITFERENSELKSQVLRLVRENQSLRGENKALHDQLPALKSDVGTASGYPPVTGAKEA